MAKREYIELGPVPAEEECQQLGPNYDYKLARRETQTYVRQLRRMFTDGFKESPFGIKSFPHDYGSYCEAVVYYNPDNEESGSFAFNVEANLPANWDWQAKEELSTLAFDDMLADCDIFETTFNC